jgi:hypothetical protein
MSQLPVVNYGRMERLRLPEDEKMNLNTWCIIFIILVCLGLYKRYVDINQSHERSYILNI